VTTKLIVYRDAEPEDAQALAALARETFVATFGHLYPPEDLAAFCGQIFTQEAQGALLARSDTEIRLATQDGAMLAYCQIGNFQLPHDTGGRRALELHRLYVVERAKGAGVAPVLMDWAMARMREHDAQDAYLGVYADNPRAQRFYARYGFEIVGAYHFPVGRTLDDERIMRARLAP
jgi:diamine N-acetyltransferase